uniref:Uncharacterized protein n=1 Tax=Panagrolaimus superbus TaxID=310955 RepID=A0A914Y0Z7_9BILA
MFRRGRYKQLRDAETDEENSGLEFVGTPSELVSPHLHRRLHQTPSYNPFEHRQGAGRDETPKTSATTSPAAAKSSALSTPKGIPTDDQLTKVIGILYFMSWTRKALKNYSNDIRKLYEIPLTERCFGKLGDNKNSTEESIETSDSRNAAKEIAKKLEKGYEVSETFTDLALIQKRVADALANPQIDLLETRAETPRHLITPIELASLSRLRTLVKMCGSWLKKTVDMESWMERNQKT